MYEMCTHTRTHKQTNTHAHTHAQTHTHTLGMEQSKYGRMQRKIHPG